MTRKMTIKRRGIIMPRGGAGPGSGFAAQYSVQFIKKHGRSPNSFGEALAGLKKTRKEAFDIFCRHFREHGFDEAQVRENAELGMKEQYDPAVAKFRQTK